MTNWRAGQLFGGCAEYRTAAIAVACLLSLSGCITSAPISNVSPGEMTETGAPPEVSVSQTDNMLGSNAPVGARSDLPAVTPQLLGEDPNDDLNIAKRYFRQGSYALAERHFRKAVELHPRDAESWIGLAASYDQLRRFDLASRAYEKALRIIGPTPELLNNQGYSYILRGDLRRARQTLQAAQARDPANPYVANNLKLLDQSERKSKSVN
jgi:Flp pilus assembly protein TadD